MVIVAHCGRASILTMINIYFKSKYAGKNIHGPINGKIIAIKIAMINNPSKGAKVHKTKRFASGEINENCLKLINKIGRVITCETRVRLIISNIFFKIFVFRFLNFNFSKIDSVIFSPIGYK